MNTTKASMNIAINEESNRMQLCEEAVCDVQGRLLAKDCTAFGKLYKPLNLGRGLRIRPIGEDPNAREELALYTDNSTTGILVLDDGVNWRVTLRFREGALSTAPQIAASIGAGATWTPT